MLLLDLDWVLDWSDVPILFGRARFGTCHLPDDMACNDLHADGDDDVFRTFCAVIYVGDVICCREIFFHATNGRNERSQPANRSTECRRCDISVRYRV